MLVAERSVRNQFWAMFENPNCTKCTLSQSCNPKARCLKGEGGINGISLAIYTDHPYFMDDRRKRGFTSEPADYLKWMLRRMSIPLDRVYMDYVAKCYPGKLPKAWKEREPIVSACSEYRFATLQKLQPKHIVAFGELSCQTFIGKSKLGEFVGTYWQPVEPLIRKFCEKVWVGYSLAYPINSPSDAYQLFGLLWMAAEEAGLSPVVNENVQPFKFEI